MSNYMGSINILDRGDAPAQAVISKNARSLAQRAADETKDELEKVMTRVDNIYGNFDMASVLESTMSSNMEYLEDIQELELILKDQIKKKKYQQQVTIFIVGFEDVSRQKLTLIKQVNEFFLASSKSLEQEDLFPTTPDIDLDDVAAKIEDSLSTADKLTHKLADINREMVVYLTNYANNKGGNKGRKKLEKALQQAKDDINSLSEKLLAVGTELDEKEEKLSSLFKQIETKNMEIHRYKSAAEVAKKNMKDTEGMQEELDRRGAMIVELQKSLQTLELEMAQASNSQQRSQARIDNASHENMLKIEDLQRQVTEKTLALEEARKDLTNLHDMQIVSLQQAHQVELDAMRSSHEEEIQKLLGEIDQCKEEIQELQQAQQDGNRAGTVIADNQSEVSKVSHVSSREDTRSTGKESQKSKGHSSATSKKSSKQGSKGSSKSRSDGGTDWEPQKEYAEVAVQDEGGDPDTATVQSRATHLSSGPSNSQLGVLREDSGDFGDTFSLKDNQSWASVPPQHVEGRFRQYRKLSTRRIEELEEQLKITMSKTQRKVDTLKEQFKEHKSKWETERHVLVGQIEQTIQLQSDAEKEADAAMSQLEGFIIEQEKLELVEDQKRLELSRNTTRSAEEAQSLLAQQSTGDAAASSEKGDAHEDTGTTKPSEEFVEESGSVAETKAQGRMSTRTSRQGEPDLDQLLQQTDDAKELRRSATSTSAPPPVETPDVEIDPGSDTHQMQSEASERERNGSRLTATTRTGVTMVSGIHPSHEATVHSLRKLLFSEDNLQAQQKKMLKALRHALEILNKGAEISISLEMKTMAIISMATQLADEAVKLGVQPCTLFNMFGKFNATALADLVDLQADPNHAVEDGGEKMDLNLKIENSDVQIKAVPDLTEGYLEIEDLNFDGTVNKDHSSSTDLQKAEELGETTIPKTVQSLTSSKYRRESETVAGNVKDSSVYQNIDIVEAADCGSKSNNSSSSTCAEINVSNQNIQQKRFRRNQRIKENKIISTDHSTVVTASNPENNKSKTANKSVNSTETFPIFQAVPPATCERKADDVFGVPALPHPMGLNSPNPKSRSILDDLNPEVGLKTGTDSKPFPSRSPTQTGPGRTCSLSVGPSSVTTRHTGSFKDDSVDDEVHTSADESIVDQSNRVGSLEGSGITDTDLCGAVRTGVVLTKNAFAVDKTLTTMPDTKPVRILCADSITNDVVESYAPNTETITPKTPSLVLREGTFGSVFSDENSPASSLIGDQLSVEPYEAVIMKNTSRMDRSSRDNDCFNQSINSPSAGSRNHSTEDGQHHDKNHGTEVRKPTGEEPIARSHGSQDGKCNRKLVAQNQGTEDRRRVIQSHEIPDGEPPIAHYDGTQDGRQPIGQNHGSQYFKWGGEPIAQNCETGVDRHGGKPIAQNHVVQDWKNSGEQEKNNAGEQPECPMKENILGSISIPFSPGTCPSNSLTNGRTGARSVSLHDHRISISVSSVDDIELFSEAILPSGQPVLEQEPDQADSYGIMGATTEEVRSSSARSRTSLRSQYRSKLDESRLAAEDRRSKSPAISVPSLLSLDDDQLIEEDDDDIDISLHDDDKEETVLRSEDMLMDIGTSPPPPPSKVSTTQSLTPRRSVARSVSHSVKGDNPVVQEYLKTYGGVVNFKDGLAKLLVDKDMMTASQVLSDLETLLFDKASKVEPQIEGMTHNVCYMLDELISVLNTVLVNEREPCVSSLTASRERTRAMLLTREKSDDSGRGLTGTRDSTRTRSAVSHHSIKSANSDSGTIRDLKETCARLQIKLEEDSKKHEDQLRHNTAVMMEMQDTINELQRELSTLGQAEKRPESTAPEMVTESCVMFTKMDSERNAKIMKKAVYEDRLDPNKYKEAVNQMDDYVTLPAQRLSHLVRKYVHHCRMKEIEENVRMSRSLNENVFEILDKMEDLQSKRANRWADKMDEMGEERQRLANLLMETFDNIEEESGIFLIKPMYSYRGREAREKSHGKLSRHHKPGRSISPGRERGRSAYAPAPTPATATRPGTRHSHPHTTIPQVQSDSALFSRHDMHALEGDTSGLTGSGMTWTGQHQPRPVWNISSSQPKDTVEDLRGYISQSYNTPRILELDINRMLIGQNNISTKMRSSLQDDRMSNLPHSALRSYVTVNRPTAGPKHDRIQDGPAPPTTPRRPLSVDSDGVRRLQSSPPLPPISQSQRPSSVNLDFSSNSDLPYPPRSPPGSSLRQTPPTREIEVFTPLGTYA